MEFIQTTLESPEVKVQGMWSIDPNVKLSSMLSCLIVLFEGHDDRCPFLSAVMLTLLGTFFGA